MGSQQGTHEIQFRVAYHETDGQRRVHHANYLNYFEEAGRDAPFDGNTATATLEDEGRCWWSPR